MRVGHVALILSASCSGCMVGEPPASSSDLPDTTALEDARTYHGLPKLNAQPYASQVGSFHINNYVAGDMADYRAIHPEQTGSKVNVAVGTVIVREVLDDRGAVSKLTIMAKGPPGYDPSLGDWWFGVTDPTGKPLFDKNGLAQVGRLTACHDCHDQRASDDFLFGVPRADDN